MSSAASSSTRSLKRKVDSDSDSGPSAAVSFSSSFTYDSEHGSRDISTYRVWLMKNEPPFSLYHLSKLPAGEQKEPWVGVRSAEAKNIMKNQMKIGDFLLYYEASIANPHISGVARVCSAPYPDPTAFDRSSSYFDKKRCDPSDPYWYLVDVELVRLFKRPVYLFELKAHAELQSLVMFRRFRLSVSPLSQREFDFILALEQSPFTEEMRNKLKKEKKPAKQEANTGDDDDEEEEEKEAAPKKKRGKKSADAEPQDEEEKEESEKKVTKGRGKKKA